MKIKKIIFLTHIVFSIGLTVGCLFKPTRYIRDDQKTADTRFKNIMKALEEKDNKGLKKMFSPNALKNAKEIDDGIDYVMNFIGGKIISKEGLCQTSELINNGEKIIILRGRYIVTTDQDIYTVFFIDKTVYTEEPDNVGLYMLQIIKKSEEHAEFDWGKGKSRCAGIYRPDDTESH